MTFIKNHTMPFGDTETFNLQFFEDDGETQLDITDGSISFIVKKNSSDELVDAIMNISGTIDDGPNGLASFSIGGGDWSSLSETNKPFYFFYLIRFVSSDQAIIKTVQRGKFIAI